MRSLFVAILTLSCGIAAAQHRPPATKQFLKGEFAWGLTLGTPGLLNLVAQVDGGDVGGRATAGALGLPGLFGPAIGVAGYELVLSAIVKRTANSVLDVGPLYSVMASRSSFSAPAYTTQMFGIATAFNADGFFFQFGLDHLIRWKNEDHEVTSSPTILNGFSVQIGYLH